MAVALSLSLNCFFKCTIVFLAIVSSRILFLFSGPRLQYFSPGCVPPEHCMWGGYDVGARDCWMQRPTRQHPSLFLSGPLGEASFFFLCFREPWMIRDGYFHGNVPKARLHRMSSAYMHSCGIIFLRVCVRVLHRTKSGLSERNRNHESCSAPAKSARFDTVSFFCFPSSSANSQSQYVCTKSSSSGGFLFFFSSIRGGRNALLFYCSISYLSIA